MLAQEWFYGLMTRPDMSIKVERKLYDMRIWGAMCQWHMFSTDRERSVERIVGVRSTEQFVWHLLTPTSYKRNIETEELPMNVYSEITPEILSLTKLAESTSKIDPALYTKYDVKRGLRDINGKGVLAGLYSISAMSMLMIW